MRQRKDKLSKLRVLSLDLALKTTGWAVIDVGEDNTLTLVDCGIIQTNPKQTHGERLREIRRGLEEIYLKYKVNTIAKERGFSRFPTETQALYKTHGVTEELFADYTVHDYAPTTVKKNVTGNGKAPKDKVAEAVKEWLKLPEDFEFVTTDDSDAAAVAITHLIKTRRLTK